MPSTFARKPDAALGKADKPGLALVGLSAAVIIMLAVWPTVDLSLGGDHYVFLAKSFRSGLLDVDDMPALYRDYIDWSGHKYLPFGPLPAVILVPFLPLLERGVPLVLFGYAAGVLNLVLFHRILGRIGVKGDGRRWLLLLYFGGTSYLSITLAGISTFFAHAVTTLFLLIAVLECLRRQRFLLIGAAVGLAAASRMTAVLAVLFFLLLIWEAGRSPVSEPGRRLASRRTAELLAGLAAPLMLVALYNFARFADPAESGFGLALLYNPVLHEARSVGLFSLQHIPKNLYMMLLAIPQPVGGESAAVLSFPFVRPSPWGMGLFFTTPALIYGFGAPRQAPLVVPAWITIVAITIPLMTYYGIGYVQFGYRYALDFMPFVMLLIAIRFREGIPPVARTLIAISVVINIWGAITLAMWI